MNVIKDANSDMSKIRAILEALMPTVLSFGPISMVIGLQTAVETHGGFSLTGHLYALVGALALSLGLLFLWKRQVGIMRRLDELEKSRIRVAI